MKKEPISRKFDSPEEMAKHATEAYQIGVKKVNQIEIDKGFDISDINSVLAFETGYTPIGNSIILKEIPKEVVEEENKLIVMDLSNTSKKYYVITPGLMVTTLEKGDIVNLGNFTGEGVKVINKTFKGITFVEAEYYSITGVYHPLIEMKERISRNETKATHPRTYVS